MKRTLFTILTIILTCFVFIQCKKIEKSEENDIINLTVTTGDEDYRATIAETTLTFSNKVPYGTTVA